jgi:hypothetical protein
MSSFACESSRRAGWAGSRPRPRVRCDCSRATITNSVVLFASSFNNHSFFNPLFLLYLILSIQISAFAACGLQREASKCASSRARCFTFLFLAVVTCPLIARRFQPIRRNRVETLVSDRNRSCCHERGNKVTLFCGQHAAPIAIPNKIITFSTLPFSCARRPADRPRTQEDQTWPATSKPP